MIVAVVALALMQNPQVDQAVARLTPELTEIRHRIHQNPELGNREFETSNPSRRR